jgi:copper transport protein
MVLAIVSIGALPASAHARLVGSDPSSGSRMDESPAQIELRFDESVEIDLGGITLASVDGADIALAAPAHGADRATVQVSVPPLDDGTYVAVWRVVSQDGHPIQGAITFAVGGATLPTVDEQVVTDLLARGAPPTAIEVVAAAARTAAYGGLLVLVGAVAVMLVGWADAFGRPRARRLLTISWIAATAGAIVQFAMQGPSALGSGLADALSPSLWVDVAGTTTGRALLARVVALGAMWFALANPRALSWTALSTAALVATAASGHAAGGGGNAIGPVAVATVHLAVAAWWIGGLAIIVLVALGQADDRSLVRLLRRFSPVALGAVVALAVTGSVQAYRQVGSIDALASTSYGRLLGTKVVLVAVMVVVASWSRTALRQHALAASTSTRPDLDGTGGVVLMEDERHSDAMLRAQLRRTVGVESLLAVAVVALTAMLVSAVPAKDDLARPVETSAVQSGVLMELLVTPGRVGSNEVHLSFARTDGGLGDPSGAEVRLVDESDPDNPIAAEVRPDGPGHFRVDTLIIPRSGSWRIDVVATDAQSSRRFSHTFEIRG